MTCHTLPLEKYKGTMGNAITHPWSLPYILHFMNGMGLRMGN